jgi:hypothetical protein
MDSTVVPSPPVGIFFSWQYSPSLSVAPHQLDFTLGAAISSSPPLIIGPTSHQEYHLCKGGSPFARIMKLTMGMKKRLVLAALQSTR